jgi:hypothetical protein
MDAFSTYYMLAFINAYVGKSPTFLRNFFFPNVMEFDTEEIQFDKINNKRRIAPLVSPLIAGKIIKEESTTLSSIKPAYIKVKRAYSPNRPLKRLAGEPLGGNLTPAQRQQKLTEQHLIFDKDSIDLRIELMCAEILRTGKVILQGDDFPTRVVDYQRDSALTAVATTLWSQNTAKPLDDLEANAKNIRKKSGSSNVREVIFDDDAWQWFRKNDEVKAEINLYRGNSTMVNDAAFIDGATYMGNIRGFNIYVYSGISENEQPILPSGSVIQASKDDLMGVQAFGAIQDEEFAYGALAYAPKTWVEKDPAVRLMLTQSAPIPVPQLVNACSYMRVLAES